MARYVALLRGINVGGKNRMRMAELRTVCEELGWRDVETYLQSGNIVFSSSDSKTNLAKALEQSIAETWEYDVAVLIATGASLKKLKTNSPYVDRGEAFEHCFVTFLFDKPSSAGAKTIKVPESSRDEFVISGRFVHGFCPDGFSRTKLTNGMFEKKLAVSATTRNWKTVIALGEMV